MGGKVPPQFRSSILRAVLQRSWIGSGHVSSGSIASTSRAFSSFDSRRRSATSSIPPSPLFPDSPPSFPLPPAFRSFSSSSSPSDGSQDAIIIDSEEALDNLLKKVQEDALPAIFYFTAAWCGPCKFLSPVVNQLSKMYPPCVTYKIDIDMEGIQSKLHELEISAVPTLNFFHGGKQVATVVGADVEKIKNVMNEFFK